MAFTGIGTMRWEVTHQAQSISGNTVQWSNTTMWASVDTQAVGETQVAGQVQGQVNYVMVFRNENTINAKDRIILGTKTLHVQSVRPLNLAYLEVLAAEKQ